MDLEDSIGPSLWSSTHRVDIYGDKESSEGLQYLNVTSTRDTHSGRGYRFGSIVSPGAHTSEDTGASLGNPFATNDKG